MKNRKTSKGDTLIELIISIALLAIIIVPISLLMVTSAKINAKSEEEMQVLSLAQKHYEFLNSTVCIVNDDLTFNSIESSVTKEFIVGDYTVYENMAQLPSFTITKDGNNQNILYKITVEVKEGSDVLQTLEGYKPIY